MMRRLQDIRGMSKFVLILLLLISFVTGAVLSYVWMMGFYAPSEYHLPKQASVTIEDVYFSPDDATSFSVTVLNPSYSSDVTIEQIKVETADGKLHSANTPSLPVPLARGTSQTIKSSWNWGNYTGQTLNIIVIPSEGSGAARRATTPFMNFTITGVNLDPSVSVNHLNITVQNAGSSTSVNITKILVNGVEVSTDPILTSPYELTNASEAQSVSFMLMRNWTDLQGQTITIQVQTVQGYTIYWASVAPRMDLSIVDVDFHINYVDRFNITVQNAESSQRGSFVDINEVKLLIENKTIVANVSLPQKLQWNSSIILTCFWNWSSYEGKDVLIVISTVQDFTMSGGALIIPKPKVAFIRWEDSVRMNTFDYPVVVSPSAIIKVENITHGIWNWDKITHKVELRISNIINSTYIQNVTIYVKLDNETIATVTWNSGDSLPTSWVSFSANASTKYTTGIEITTTPYAVTDETSVVSLEIKTENP